MTNSASLIRIGTATFDAATGELRRESGDPVPLRPQTANVLAVLAASSGELVTKADLMEEVWKDANVTDDSLVQCISEIRRALGPDQSRLLRTIPRHGYCLDIPVPAETVDEMPAWQPAPILKLGAGVFVAFALAAMLLAWVIVSRTPDTTPRTIAVLPFVNMNGGSGQDYFSDGLAEDLLTDLSKIEDLTVLSRTSTFAFRDRRAGLETIAGELGASHLVDGSVRRDGDRVRITVQLIDTGTGASLWAERYDREMGDLFSLQDDLRGRIISALSLRLSPSTTERMDAGRATEVNAYDLLLQGRYAESAMNHAGVTRAIALYEAAIAAEPGYANAHARLANMLDISSRLDWSEDPRADHARALEMAETAVRLAPRDAFSHWTLGRVLSRVDSGRVDDALKALQTAITLDPNYADAYAFAALLYIGEGRAAEAQAAMKRANRLNPDGPSWYDRNEGIISFLTGDLDKAVSRLELAVEQNPTAPFNRLWLAAAYAQAGRTADAEWQIEEARMLEALPTAVDVLNSNPVIRTPEYRDTYLTGLLKAGLPM